ncbi:hypothetical protein [Streptomyces sp. RB17]|nr:hypothetical protein [Streptomyces sp. RB17]
MAQDVEVPMYLPPRPFAAARVRRCRTAAVRVLVPALTAAG